MDSEAALSMAPGRWTRGIDGPGRVPQGSACASSSPGGSRPPYPVSDIARAWIGAVPVLRGAGSGLVTFLAGVAETGWRADDLGGWYAVLPVLRQDSGDILKNSGNTFIP